MCNYIIFVNYLHSFREINFCMIIHISDIIYTRDVRKIFMATPSILEGY